MALAVLGPMQLDGVDRTVVVSNHKARVLLTMLALAAPRPVSLGTLCQTLWDDPPPAAVKTVQGHLSRIRTALSRSYPPAGRVVGGPVGYRLETATDLLDVLTVADLRRRARLRALAGDDEAAERLLREARDRWRGEPELPDTVLGGVERDRLTEQRLQLEEDHLAAVIAVGHPARAVPELEALAAEHPLRERLWALRIEALYHTGRQTEALGAYREVRRRLLEEIGAEPAPELRRLEMAVLRQSLPPPRPAPSMAPEAPPLATDIPHYAEVDGAYVAYGRLGTGPADLLLLNPTFIPVDAYAEESHVAQAMATLARGRSVLAFDRRGLGLSDPVTPASPPTLSAWVHDAVGVLDDAGMDRVHVLGNADTSLIALRLAAEHPERVASLTLVNGYARFTAGEDYPYGSTTKEMAATLRSIHTPGSSGTVDVVEWRLPEVQGDTRFRAWWDVVGRRGASPQTAALVHRLIVESDVRGLLPRVNVPVLLLSRLGCASYDVGHGRFLATHLPHATLKERADPNDAWFVGDVDWVVDELNDFTRTRTAADHRRS